MFHFFLDPAREATQVAARSGLSLLESSILGAITLLSIGLAIWSVVKSFSIQDKRAQDLERYNERLSSVVTKMTETFADVSNSLDNLIQSERDGNFVLQGVKNSLDIVVLEAVRALRGNTPQSTKIPSRGRVTGE